MRFTTVGPGLGLTHSTAVRRRVTVVGRAVAILTGAVVLSTSGVGMAAEPLDNDRNVARAEAQRFREDFGLRADLDYVQDSISDAAEFPNLDWGVPLTRDEAGDLYRRLAIQRSLKDATGYAVPQDDYAGMFLD